MSRSVTPSLFQYLKALLRRTRVASLEGPSKAGSFELGPILELAAPAVTVLLSVGLGRLASRTASGIQVALALCAAAGCGQSLGVGPGSESPRTWDPAAAPLPDIGGPGGSPPARPWAAPHGPRSKPQQGPGRWGGNFNDGATTQTERDLPCQSLRTAGLGPNHGFEVRPLRIHGITQYHSVAPTTERHGHGGSVDICSRSRTSAVRYTFTQGGILLGKFWQQPHERTVTTPTRRLRQTPSRRRSRSVRESHRAPWALSTLCLVPAKTPGPVQVIRAWNQAIGPRRSQT
jgi:hypothetical protein